MKRIMSLRQQGTIAWALETIPEPHRRIMGEVDFFCGDPLFAGLHHFGNTDSGEGYAGSSYRKVAHCCAPFHTTDSSLTIVLPTAKCLSRGLIRHELGHALHIRLDERGVEWPEFEPVTKYAKTNRYEAFAEAYWLSFYGPKWLDPDERYDSESRAYFDRLGCE